MQDASGAGSSDADSSEADSEPEVKRKKKKGKRLKLSKDSKVRSDVPSGKNRSSKTTFKLKSKKKNRRKADPD
jgi:hypothetical protein